MMNLKVLKLQILRGSIAKRVLLRAFLFAFAMAIFPFLELVRDVEPTKKLFDDCALGVSSNPFSFPGRFLKPMSVFAFPPCKEMSNFTKDMFIELMDEKLLKSDVKALCVGEESTAYAVTALRELGFSNVFGMNRHPFFSLMRKGLIYELEFDDNSFDFVFSSDIDKVSVPALLVLEIERVLKAGGIGAMLLHDPLSNPGSLIKSATPISLFLKSSDVLRVRSIQSFLLVIFRKRLDLVNPFEHYQLPHECPSIMNNKPFIQHLEPILEESPHSLSTQCGFSYLPNFMNISSRNRFIYIDIGAGKFMNSNTTNWFLTYYPVPSRGADVYVVDHNTTVLSSYVNRPGITFVYHPGLSGNNVTAIYNPAGDNEGFDFLVWFRETVALGDFVVLKMNAVGVELKLLHELFESGAICLIDELFLRCPDITDGQGNMRQDCVELFKGLRSRGVFVHQWLDD